MFLQAVRKVGLDHVVVCIASPVKGDIGRPFPACFRKQVLKANLRAVVAKGALRIGNNVVEFVRIRAAIL
jgi:hypothetical protein